MRYRTRQLLSVLLAVVVVGAAACAKTPRATVAQVDLNTAASMNPDDTGRPSPLRVRFYELKSVGAFQGAAFSALLEKDQEVLGADLLAREEIQLAPDTQTTITRKLNPDTRFLAVMAPYRQWEKGDTWRAHMEVPPKKTVSVVVQLEEIKVSIEPAQKKRRGSKKK